MKSRLMRLAGRVCSSIRKRKTACRILVRKPIGSRPRRRWVDNIKIDLGEIGYGGIDWISLA
jgi:hypothetical protein